MVRELLLIPGGSDGQCWLFYAEAFAAGGGDSEAVRDLMESKFEKTRQDRPRRERGREGSQVFEGVPSKTCGAG
jgi:hypothetical protein